MIEPRPGQSPPDGIYLGHLEEVEMADPEWLLNGFLLAGELTILQGHGGTSKGTLACAWAAMVTQGRTEPLVLGEKITANPRHVLWASAEDSISTVLKPRLVAADADISLVKPFGFRREGTKDALSLPGDVPALKAAVEDLDAALVIIDPILSHLAGGIDSYRDHEVKRALRPLAQMANETGCAVLGVHHFGKDTSRGAYLSGQASGAFGNTARMVLAIAEHDEDDYQRVLEVVKTNVSRKGLRMALRVDLVSVDGLNELVPRIVRQGTADRSVNELLRSSRKREQAHQPGVFG